MRKLLLRTLLSVALGAGLLWWVIHSMLAEHVEPGQSIVSLLAAEFAAVPLWAVLAYTASFVVVHLARTFRWTRQVIPLGETDQRLLFRVAIVGYAAIVLLPLRMGEAVRPWLLARESRHVGFAAALGTAVAERIIDGLLISGLLSITVLTAPQPASALVRNAAWLSGGVFVAASVGIALFIWQRRLALWLLDQTFGRISPRIAARLTELLGAFVDGLASLRRSGALAAFLALTVVYWSANAFGIWLLAHAFGLEVPLIAGFGLLAVLVVGIMLPAGPGFLGNFQLFLTEGLRLYLPGAAVGGFAFALAMNLIQIAVMVAFAIPMLAAGRMGLGEILRAVREGGTQRGAAADSVEKSPARE